MSLPRFFVAALAALIALAGAPAARGQGASRTWIVSGSFRQIHSSNLFSFVPNGPSDVISSPSFSLSYARTDARTSLSASASAYALQFGQQTQFNKMGATFSLGGSHRFSRRARTGFSLARSSRLPTESLYLSRTRS